MVYQASEQSHRLSQQWQTLILLGGLLAALLSLAYAALTTSGTSIDLRPLQDMAIAWVEGNYNQTLRFNIYPPATVVLLSPLSLLSFNALTIAWFILNLGLTGLSSHLAVKLIGSDWPWRVQCFLVFFIVTWAPLRVLLRNGQITMVIIALLLGSLLALRSNHLLLSGVLFGLALCKYTLTFPFIFYFVWQQQWKVILSAAGLQLALTGVFAYRLGINLIEVVVDYFTLVSRLSLSFPAGGDLNSLLLGLTGGHKLLSISLGVVVVVLALGLMFLIIRHRPHAENAHCALLALFALWSVYHRTYDFMLCLIPVAVLIDFVMQRRWLAFSYFWLVGFSLLALGLPGFVASQLRLGGSQGYGLTFILIQSERLLVMVVFWSLLWALWKRTGKTSEESSARNQSTIGNLT